MSSITNRVRSLTDYFSANGPVATARFILIKARAAVARSDLGWSLLYEQNPLVNTGQIDDYEQQAAEVWNQIKQLRSIEAKEYALDVPEFHDYVRQARYESFDSYYQGGDSGNALHRTEKLLQHYLSLKFLDIQANDVYIDVASNTSPMKRIVRNLRSGVATYSMDLKYPPGINGDNIGCDAGATPLADGSVSHMSLHCAFEHFAYGADCRFIREAERILRAGGRVCIVPLYMLKEYSIQVDPTWEADISVRDPEEAQVVYVRGYNVDYGRFYDAKSFEERIVQNLGSLKAIVYRISNLEDLEPDHCYSNFALVLEKQPLGIL